MVSKAEMLEDQGKLPTTILEMPWRDSDKKIDSGIYAMRHMETYFGNGLAGWRADLTKGNKKQIETMRVKYGGTMIGNHYNEIKIDMVKKAAVVLRKE